MRFTADDKQLVKWMWVKKCVENGCSRCLWQKMKSWGKDTDHNISARSLTLLILSLQWGGHCVVDHNPKTRVIDVCTAVTFSFKCFHAVKLYIFCQETSIHVFTSKNVHIFRKWFASYSFIYSQAFNNLISNGKSYCCNDTLLTSGYIAANKEYLRRIQIFH